MAAGARRQQLMLLFTVLAGLFLMHGLSAPSMHGMPMATPMPVSSHMDSHMGSHMGSYMGSAEQAPTGASATVSGTVPATGHMEAGETCVPLRPDGMSGLFLVLFLIVVAPWRPRLPNAPRPIHPHWPHGPPRPGIQILHALSISRT